MQMVLKKCPGTASAMFLQYNIELKFRVPNSCNNQASVINLTNNKGQCATNLFFLEKESGYQYFLFKGRN